MPYNPEDRSELEKQFEVLFLKTFKCPVETFLTPQYEVFYKDKRYRIDYAFVSGDFKIAIELDGRGKFIDGGKEEFKRHMSRENALEDLDFKVYHLTWDDVVNNNGEVALGRISKVIFSILKKSNLNEISLSRHENLLNEKVSSIIQMVEGQQAHKNKQTESLYQLLQFIHAELKVLKNNNTSPDRFDKISTELERLALKPTGEEPTFELLSLQKDLSELNQAFKAFRNEVSLKSVSKDKSSDLEDLNVVLKIAQAKLNEQDEATLNHSVLEHSQSHSKGNNQSKLKYKSIYFILAAALFLLVGLYYWSHGGMVRLDKSQSDPVKVSPSVLLPERKSTYSEKVVTSKVKQAKPKLSPILVNSPPPTKTISLETTIIQSNDTSHKPPESTPDPIVLFNSNSGIYHKPECPIAKTCKNCVPLTLAEAKDLGGRPSKICDIPH